MGLFNKAAVFGDIHFGAKSNSDAHNIDCINFIQWFIQEAKAQGCDACLFLGDYHNNRSTMNLKTMDYAVSGLELLSNAFPITYFIPGNHDLFFRDNRSVHSTKWASHIPRIEIINDWFVGGDIVIAPWLVGDDYKSLKKRKGKYIFGHFELPGFLLNSMIKMPDHGEISDSHFGKFDHCFSGHFHKRQTNKNITYIGNAFPHNFSDAGDYDRGMMILEWDKPPVYLSWPDQPTFTNMKLSELLDDNVIISPRQHVKASIDVDISYEESIQIKEKFVEDKLISELILITGKKSSESKQSDQVILSSVDATVADQLAKIESEKFDTKLLLSIYNEL